RQRRCAHQPPPPFPTRRSSDLGADADILYGERGKDRMFGDEGNDMLAGGEDGDTLYGGPGNDRVYGNDRDDTLYGGTGDDLVGRSEEHTSELQSRVDLVCRLLL